jgi:hypothetical protein
MHSQVIGNCLVTFRPCDSAIQRRRARDGGSGERVVGVTLKAAFDEIVFASHMLLDLSEKMLGIRFSIFAAGLSSHLGET